MTPCRLDRPALLRGTALQAAFGLILAPVAFAQPAPNARPLGGQVVAGAAAIANTANATTITQSTNRAAIEWRSFDVGSKQRLTFQQPSSSAVTLNRVTGGDPSAIAGQISANGQIILTNRSGVTFYQGAQVNAHSVVVSAADISNKNFMAGKMVFDRPANPDARIENHGTITVAQAGLAALVAPSVSNSGVINARLGQVILAGAAAHTLDMYGDGLVSIDVTKQVVTAPAGANGQAVTALVTNTGIIAADGGVVQLTAYAADGVVQTLVRAGGKIHANTVGDRAGRIEVAGTGGSVVVEGRLAADGRAPGTTGGQIMVAGSDTTLIAAGAHISANGRGGGGTVAIGTTLARARSSGAAPVGTSVRTVVASGAKIKADAIDRGNGGRVTVLSTQDTAIAGALSARGGKSEGNGGTIELSGAKGFALTGTADTSAPQGGLGTILLDPANLTIVSNAGADTIIPAGNASPDANIPYGAAPATATVRAATIEALTGNVFLQATNDLIVQAPLSLGSRNLTLEAGNTLTIASSSTITTSGRITLTAAAADIPGNNPAGALFILGAVNANGNLLQVNAGTGGITLAANVTAGQLGINTPGSLTQTAGGITAGDMFGSAGAVSLTSRTNAIGGVASRFNAFTVTGATGDFTLVDSSPLTVGGQSTEGGIRVQGGRTITVQTDRLTFGTPYQTVLSAPGGTLTLAPYTAGFGISVTNNGDPTPGVLSITTAQLANTNAATLQLGILDGNGTPTAGAIKLGNTSDVIALTSAETGGYTALHILAGGAVTEGGTVIVDTLSGKAASLTLASMDNTIQTLAGFTATAGDIVLRTQTGLTVSGTVNANAGAGLVTLWAGSPIAGNEAGASMVLASDIVANTVTLIDSAEGSGTSGGIQQTGGIITAVTVSGYVGRAQLTQPNRIQQIGQFIGYGDVWITTTLPLSISDTLQSANGAMILTAGGGLTQTAGSRIIAQEFDGSAGGDTVLTNPSNAIESIGYFHQTAGNFSLATAGSTLTFGANTGLINASAGSLTFIADAVELAPSPAGGISAPNGVVTFAPITPGRRIELIGATAADPASLSLSQAFLNRITAAKTLAIGNAATTGLINIGNVNETVTIPNAIPLYVRTTNAVVQGQSPATQDGGGILGLIASDVSGQVGNLNLGGAVNQIGSLGAGSATPGFSGLTSGGSTYVFTSNDLAVSNTLSANMQDGILQIVAGGRLTDAAGLIRGSLVALQAGTDMVLGGNIVTGGVYDLVNLSAGGAIIQGAGSLTTSQLSVSASSAALNSTTNAVGALAGFNTTGDFSFYDSVGLIVSERSDPDLVTLTVRGDLAINSLVAGNTVVLNVLGSITEANEGSILAGTLTGSAHSANFSGNNAIATLGGFTTVSGLTLINGQGLTVTGPVTDGQSISLSARGNLAVSGTINAPVVALSSISGPSVGGGISLTSGLVSGSLSVSLTSGTTIRQTGGTIAAGTLIGSSIGSTHLNNAGNSVTVLGPFNSSGGFSLSDGTALLVNGPLTDAASVSLNVAGPVALNATVQTDALSLIASGAITQQGGSVTAGTLVGNAAALALTGAGNRIQTVGAFTTTGDLALVDGAALTVSGAVSVGNGHTLSLASDRLSITTGGSLNALGGTVMLAVYTAGDGISFAGTPPIAATTLVVGTPTGGPVTITGMLNLGSVSVLDLESAGAITETGAGAIGVATLTGHGASANLNGANQIATLGEFATTAGFSLVNSQALTVAGPVTDARSIALRITGAMTLSGLVSAPVVALTSASGPGAVGNISQTGGLVSGTTLVSLTSAGAISQSGGAIAAGTLSGSAADALTLTSAGNAIATLAGFTTPGAFMLTNSTALTLSGLVSAASAGLMVTGDLALAGTVNAAGVVSLVASGAITEGANGVVSAGMLTGTAASASLSGSNAIATLGGFTTSSGFDLMNVQALAVSGPVVDGRSVALRTRGPLTLTGTVSAPVVALTSWGGPSIGGGISQTDGLLSGTTSVSLTSAGAISQSGGTIIAGTLRGSSIQATSLGRAGNAIAVLGGFSSAGGFTLADASAMAVNGTLTDTTSINLSTAGALSLNATVQTGALTLAAGGAITQPGGLVSANILSGNGASLALNQRGNQIATLGHFASAGDLTLVDNRALAISGTVSAGGGHRLVLSDDNLSFTAGGFLSAPGGTVALAEYTPGGGITLAGGSGLIGTPPIAAASLVIGTASGGPVTIAGMFNLSTVPILDLESSGAITELGTGAIQVGTLIGSASSVSLAGPNRIGVLGGFTTPGAFTLNNAQSLNVTGSLAASSVAITVNGDLALAGTIVAPDFVSLVATRSITQTSGAITTTSLSGDAASAALTSTGNTIATLAGFIVSGDFALADNRSLTVSAPIDPNMVTLAIDGDLLVNSSIAAGMVVLNVSGTITEGTNGLINAGTLAGAAQSASLSNLNQIAAISTFTTHDGFSLASGQQLTVTGQITDDQSVRLSAAGLTLSGGVAAPLIVLATAGDGSNTIRQTAGTIAGRTITLQTPGGFNQTGGAITAPGALMLTVGGDVTLAGDNALGGLSLRTGGAVIQTGGRLAIATLTGSAGSINLGRSGVASLDAIADLSAASALSIVDRTGLQISGALAAPQLAITATDRLTLNGGVIRTDGAPLDQQLGAVAAPVGSSLLVLAGASGNATLSQLGTTSVGSFSGGRATLRLGLLAGGTLTLDALDAPNTNLVLALGSGTATGTLNAYSLSVLGPAGSARLTGSVAGQSGFGAAQVSRVSPASSPAYTLNGCAIASVSCVADTSFLTSVLQIASVLRPDILTLDVLDLSVTRDRDDPTLLLPNISNRDY